MPKLTVGQRKVLSDLNKLFRDDAFVERVWTEANRLLAEERPQVEAELVCVTSDTARAREALDKYFQAFESGDDLKKVFETATNPQRKHLLHELVKKVLVHSKESVEVWYRFPQTKTGPAHADPVRTQPHLARLVYQCGNPRVPTNPSLLKF